PCLNCDSFDYDDSHDCMIAGTTCHPNHTNPINHINQGSDKDGNPSGLSRSVEDVRSLHPASRSGCIPDGMQRRVWDCVSTERHIPTGCRYDLSPCPSPQERGEAPQLGGKYDR
ncbi:MAG: hypothetical protein LBD27_02685, partial [Tannerella sp.]|nr:hypothetical protein [Tannerella sp.]